MPDIKLICDACQKERQIFSEDGFKHSPACAKLWQLAFKKDDDAWNCVKTIFEPWVNRLCGTAIAKAPAVSGLSKEDVVDVVQDIWHNLLRYIVRNPEEAGKLVERDDISRVIGLIKTTSKNRVLELCRKPRGNEDTLFDGDDSAEDDGVFSARQVPKMASLHSESLLDLLAFIKKHIQTTKEAIVAEVILLQAMKPQDVFDLYPQHFKDVKDVNQTLQTFVRRMRNDPARRNFDGSASLQFRLDQDEVRMDISEPCPYDEGILLDYLNVHLELHLRQAIERSPACMAAMPKALTSAADLRTTTL